jgi:hypothetical protein
MSLLLTDSQHKNNILNIYTILIDGWRAGASAVRAAELPPGCLL